MTIKVSTTWTTRDGDEIRISDMDSDHICNCVASLQGKKEKLSRTKFVCARIEEEIKNIDDQIEIFVVELNERGLV